jgi:hypothetical protein
MPAADQLSVTVPRRGLATLGRDPQRRRVGGTGGGLRAARTMAVTPVAQAPWRRWRRPWLAWVLWALAIVGLVVTVWLDQLLRETGRPELVVLVPSAVAPVLGAVSTATVGVLVAGRRPAHPVGWSLLAFGLSLSAAGVTVAYTNCGVAHAGAPAAGLVALYVPATIVAAIGCNAFILLLTPTGSLPSPCCAGWRESPRPHRSPCC